MLAYWQGSLLLAPAGTEMGHLDWLMDLFGEHAGEDVFKYCIRGFVRGNVLALYATERETGDKFSHFMPAEHVWKIYCLLGKPAAVNVIWRGMKPAGPGVLWQSKTEMTPADLERHLARKSGSQA
jgi:hypothetical protein